MLDHRRAGRFADEQAGRPLDGVERLTVLNLLEMARFALLMYTSCGWFFDELSGLEGQQVLRYAARAIELYELLSSEPLARAHAPSSPAAQGRLERSRASTSPPAQKSLEPDFLAALAEARSNLPALGDGAAVFRALVAPARVSHERLAAEEAILALFLPLPRERRFGSYRVRRSGERRAGDARFALYTGRMTCEWLPTGELNELTFAVLHVGAADVCCAVAPFVSGHRRALEALWQSWRSPALAPLLRTLEHGLGPANYTVRSLIPEERERVLTRIYGELLSGVGAEYARLYDNHRHTMHLLRDAGLPIPEPLRQAAEAVVRARFEAEIARQRRSRDPARYRRAMEMAEDARRRELTLGHTEAQRTFGEMLCDLVAAVVAEPRAAQVQEALALIELASRLGIDAVTPRAQELLYTRLPSPEALAVTRPLALALGFAEGAFGQTELHTMESRP
jgi:hypothetical protein